MISVRVFATDEHGKEDQWDTSINGTINGAREYFIGKQFNIGDTFDPCKDRMAIPHKVVELDTQD